MSMLCLNHIGIIHSPFLIAKESPIQPCFAEGSIGSVELLPEYIDGLADIEGFSHIILLYHLHLSNGYKLIVKPFLDSIEHGIFATRFPQRPNPIGLSVVKLNRIENNIIYIENIDVIDGTPILDIKPYVPKFDSFPAALSGWVTGKI